MLFSAGAVSGLQSLQGEHQLILPVLLHLAPDRGGVSDLPLLVRQRSSHRDIGWANTLSAAITVSVPCAPVDGRLTVLAQGSVFRAGNPCDLLPT